MSRYRKSWTQAMQEVQESAALQLKMAFDDAKIKRRWKRVLPNK